MGQRQMKKLQGYTIVDQSGLILGFRAAAHKAWDRRDLYEQRGISVTVYAAQLSLEEVNALERAEASRGPLAMQMDTQARGAA